MAEPVTKKIDTLPAMTDAVATNDKLLLLDVSAPATTMTKLITMNQVRISSAAQLDANVVENAKIKDGAVSTPKLDQTAGSQAVATGTIRDNAVTFSKMQDVDGYSVVGRSGSTAGDADEITAGENTVLGRVGTGNVAFNKLATTQLANTNARTVIGNATNASATPSTIASNTDGHVLRQNGDTLGFGTLTDKSLATGAVTADKLAAEVINDINKNLVYIQLFQPDEAIITTSAKAYFFVPSYLAGKKVKQLGIGIVSSSTGKTVRVALGSSYGSVSGVTSAETANTLNYTLPAALTKIPINVTVTAGTPAPQGLDFWFLVI